MMRTEARNKPSKGLIFITISLPLTMVCLLISLSYFSVSNPQNCDDQAKAEAAVAASLLRMIQTATLTAAEEAAARALKTPNTPNTSVPIPLVLEPEAPHTSPPSAALSPPSSAPKPKHDLTICNMIDGHTPMSLWLENMERIFKASQHPIDKSWEWYHPTAAVLKLITPRLLLAQRSFPRDWKTLAALMRKTEKRHAYLKSLKTGNEAGNVGDGAVVPPPIKIAVYGGSVTAGHNGYKLPMNFEMGSWPFRLEHLINTLAGGQLVEVHNMAEGATNSWYSQVLLQYNLLPTYALFPDIVINDHATNDNYNLPSPTKSKEEVLYDGAQGFARTVLNLCTQEGTAPLLIWTDDYMGNYHPEILANSELSQGVQVLANYYGFGFLSYADMVRDLVYSDTTETLFSPRWYKEGEKHMSNEVHPGPTAYLAKAYMIAYYLLQIGSNYCSLDVLNPDLIDSSTDNYNVSRPEGLPAEHEQSPHVIPPKPRLAGLPPKLDSKLRIYAVTELWEKESEAQKNHCSSTSANVQCPFYGFTTARRVYSLDPLIKHFEPFTVQPAGWKIMREFPWDKFGFMPAGMNAKLTLKFDFEQEINFLLVFFMKSYGPKWENSTIQVSVRKEDNTTVELGSVVGVHDKKSSEVYVEVLPLPDPQKHFQVVFQHRSGNTSKLMGFATCSN